MVNKFRVKKSIGTHAVVRLTWPMGRQMSLNRKVGGKERKSSSTNPLCCVKLFAYDNIQCLNVLNPFTTEPLTIFLLLEADNLGVIH